MPLSCKRNTGCVLVQSDQTVAVSPLLDLKEFATRFYHHCPWIANVEEGPISAGFAPIMVTTALLVAFSCTLNRFTCQKS